MSTKNMEHDQRNNGAPASPARYDNKRLDHVLDQQGLYGRRHSLVPVVFVLNLGGRRNPVVRRGDAGFSEVGTEIA